MPSSTVPSFGLNNLIHILLLCLFVSSQETPSISVPRWSTDYSYRTNFCPLHEAVENGQIKRRDALRGLNISVGFLSYQLNNETGAIDPEYPNIAIDILDEIAAMAGFSYRNSYGVIDPPLVHNETWTEILFWGVGVYDVMGEWFIESVERLAEGSVLYPEGYYDGNFILVQRHIKAESSATLDLLAWTTPFTPGLWGLIAATTIFSGFVYYILDYFDSWISGKPLDVTLEESIFYSAFSFNGHYTHEPKSRGTRILVFSLAFFFLIIAAAYTANLASFLVLRNSPKLVINSIQDAIRHELTICVEGRAAAEDYLQTYRIPQSRIVRGEGPTGAYFDLLDGKCDILLTTRGEYETYRRKAEFNPHCDLEYVGRIVKFVSAGFVVGDSEPLCASLLRDILHIYMLEMKNNPTFDLLWEQYRAKAATVTCDLGDDKDVEESNNNENSIGVKNLSGMFVLHLIALSVSLISTLYTFCLQTKERRRGMMSEVYQASFNSLVNGLPGDESLSHVKDFKDETKEETMTEAWTYHEHQNPQQQQFDSMTKKNCSFSEHERAIMASSSSVSSSRLVKLLKETLQENNQQHIEEMESMRRTLEESNQKHKEELEFVKEILGESNQQHREEIIQIHRQHQNDMEQCLKRHQQEMNKFRLLSIKHPTIDDESE